MLKKKTYHLKGHQGGSRLEKTGGETGEETGGGTGAGTGGRALTVPCVCPVKEAKRRLHP